MPDPEAIEWKNRGDQYVHEEQYEDALQCYRYAVHIDPGYLSAWNNLGFTLVKLGRKEEANIVRNKIKELKKPDNIQEKKRKIPSRFALSHTGISIGIICFIIIAGSAFFILLRNPTGMWETSSSIVLPDSSTMDFTLFLSPNNSVSGNIMLYQNGSQDQEVYLWGELSGQWERIGLNYVVIHTENGVSHQYSTNDDCYTEEYTEEGSGSSEIILIYNIFTDQLVWFSRLGGAQNPIVFHREKSFNFQKPVCIAQPSPFLGSWQAFENENANHDNSVFTIIVNPDSTISVFESVNVSAKGVATPVILQQGTGTWEEIRKWGELNADISEMYYNSCNSLEDYQKNRCLKEPATPIKITFQYDPENDEIFLTDDVTVRFHRIQSTFFVPSPLNRDDYFLTESQSYFQYLRSEWNKVNYALAMGDTIQALKYAERVYDHLNCDETGRDLVGQCVYSSGSGGLDPNYRIENPLSDQLEPVQRAYLDAMSEFKRGVFWTITTISGRINGDMSEYPINYNTTNSYFGHARESISQANNELRQENVNIQFFEDWMYLKDF